MRQNRELVQLCVSVPPSLVLFPVPSLLSVPVPLRAPPRSSLGTDTIGFLTDSLPKEPGSPPFSHDSNFTAQQHLGLAAESCPAVSNFMQSKLVPACASGHFQYNQQILILLQSFNFCNGPVYINCVLRLARQFCSVTRACIIVPI